MRFFLILLCPRQFHPDKHVGAGAAESAKLKAAFIAVGEAFQLLTAELNGDLLPPRKPQRSRSEPQKPQRTSTARFPRADGGGGPTPFFSSKGSGRGFSGAWAQHRAAKPPPKGHSVFPEDAPVKRKARQQAQQQGGAGWRHHSSSTQNTAEAPVGRGNTTPAAPAKAECKGSIPRRGRGRQSFVDIEDDEEVAQLWARERQARQRSEETATMSGDPIRTQPREREDDESIAGRGYFGSATTVEDVESDLTAKVSEFLKLYREEMARGHIEAQPKARDGATISANGTGAMKAGVDPEAVSLLNKGIRCTAPKKATERAQPAFLWCSRDGTELYWRFAGPGASGKPEEVVLLHDILKVGTKGASLVVLRPGGGSLSLQMDDPGTAKAWARAVSQVAKQGSARGAPPG